VTSSWSLILQLELPYQIVQTTILITLYSYPFLPIGVFVYHLYYFCSSWNVCPIDGWTNAWNFVTTISVANYSWTQNTTKFKLFIEFLSYNSPLKYIFLIIRFFKTADTRTVPELYQNCTRCPYQNVVTCPDHTRKIQDFVFSPLNRRNKDDSTHRLLH